MSDTFTWNQEHFDSTLKEYLMAHESRVWPKLINKKAFYVALGAFRACQRVSPARIESALSKIVYTRQGGGPPRQVELGYALASKRASEGWSSSRRFEKLVKLNRAGGRGASPERESAAWDAEIKDKRKQITGARKASVGFLQAGFVSIVYQLGPIVGDNRRPGRGDSHFRGAVKGSVLHLAREGDLSITIENRAHSKTEHLGGFERIGGEAMQTSLNVEQISMAEHLEKDMEPEIQKFNARQQH